MVLTNLTFLILFSIFYVVGISYLYFKKMNINSKEKKIYAAMLIFNLIGLFLQLLCSFVSEKYEVIPIIISNLTLKALPVYFVVWISLMFLYLIEITFKDNNKLTFLTVVISIITSIIIVLSPFELYRNVMESVYYVHGLATNITFIYSMVLSVLMTLILIIKHNSIDVKKSMPIWLFLVLGIVMMIIQMINQSLVITVAVESLVCCLMYFTIENPEIQLLSELYKNKKLIEKANEDTSNFLFKMTQDIKRPVKEIIEISKNMEELDNISDLKISAKEINNKSIDVDYLINDALDVSNMNTRTLKIYDSRYNPVNLFKEVEYRFENDLDKNVKFTFEMSKAIPSYLYGDSIKLKQVINSLLNNAKDHTSSGEIVMSVSGLVKYGICRLIIDVTDTGKGMSIETVNEILSLNSEQLSKINLHNRDGEILKLKEVKKLVTLLGGNMMVKSEEGKGTTVNIVLDQKIVETKETEISKKLENYEQTLYKNKKVMVVDDDAKELARITTYLEVHDADVSGSLFGRDCIEKISSNVKYDLILLDDETSTYSALEVLKELKRNKKFNTPVVVLINDNKEFIKLHYLQDGFADCVMKSKLESEINRIMKRF